MQSPILAPSVGPSFLVSQVGAFAQLEFGARLAPLGLKPHHAGVLRIVDKNPDLSQQALSEALGVFASRLVLLLDDLEKLEMIERRVSPTDRRTYGIRLTPGGRKALATIGKVTAELEAHLFAGLTEKEVEQLVGLLERVVEARGLRPGVHTGYGQMKQ